VKPFAQHGLCENTKSQHFQIQAERQKIEARGGRNLQRMRIDKGENRLELR